VKKLSVALIGGAGFMGKAHSIAYSLAPVLGPIDARIEKTVLVDASIDVARRAADELGWAEYSDDWRAVIARDDIDIIDVVTPPNLHAEIAKAAIAAGKHVFVEKPITNDTAEAFEMAAAAEAAGVANQVGFNYRHTPAVTLAKSLIDSGRIGAPLQFRATYLQDVGFFNKGDFGWRNTKASGGSGAVGDIGSHIVDMAEYLNGDIVRVVGSIRAITNPPTGWVEDEDRIGRDLVDHGGVWLAQFANGSIGTFAVSFYSSGNKNRITFEVDGTEGGLQFNWNEREALKVSSTDDPSELSGFRTVLSSQDHEDVWYPVPGLGLGYADGAAVQLRKFVTSIVERKLSHPNFGEAAHVESVIDAVDESTRTGGWVEVARTRVPAVEVA
jgi:predicted dehydrogenase